MSLLSHPHVRTTAPRGGRSRLLSRALAGCWLAFQVLVVGGAPLVDALDGHGTSVVTHWEDASDDRCPPQHDELGCPLAPVIHAAGLGSMAPAPVQSEYSARRAPRPMAADTDGREAQRAAPGSRGPPTA